MQLVPTRKKHFAKKMRGLSLIEVIMVTGLFSAISLFTIVLYSTAVGDFEQANSKTSMNTYGRRAVSRMMDILSTATARRPFAVPEALYWPDPDDVTSEQTYIDFLSASNFIKASATECSYAFDNGSVTPGYTPLFRYRLAWTAQKLGNIPASSVYLERLQLDPIASTAFAGGYRQIISPNVGRLTFRRTLTGTIQVRAVIYAYVQADPADPNSWRGIDGSLMRTMTKRKRQDKTALGNGEQGKSFEILTSVPLPTLTLR